ncbi:MAG: ABC transporter permease, partial [Saprospiraceae bacterium]
QKVKNDILKILPDSLINKIDTSHLKVSDTEDVFIYQFLLNENYPDDTIKQIKYLIASSLGDFKDNLEWECPFNLNELDRSHYVAFNFSRLDRVRPFKNMMKDRFQIDISMDQVEAKENFSIVSNLTYFISLGLFFFSIISIVLFVNSKLKSHLEDNKANLGTFKAFGLRNFLLVKIYISVIASFLIIAFFIASIPALFFYFINQYGKFSIITLLDYRIFAAFIFLFLICLFISARTIIIILRDSPGDLIYGRQGTLKKHQSDSFLREITFSASRNKKRILIYSLFFLSVIIVSIFAKLRFHIPVEKAAPKIIASKTQSDPVLSSPVLADSLNIEIKRTESEQKADEQRSLIVEKQITESPYATALIEGDSINCDAIFKDFETQVNLSISKGKITDRLIETTNDPLLQSCLQKEKYEKRYNSLIELLDNLD